MATAKIERTASGVWRGDLRGGSGEMSSGSGTLDQAPFTFATRFENAKGTNPEELIAAAQAGCYSMALANYLAQQGLQPQEIVTRAIVTMENLAITRMHLETRGRVPGLDDATFKRLAAEAERKCPVANLLRSGLTLTLDAALA